MASIFTPPLLLPLLLPMLLLMLSTPMLEPPHLVEASWEWRHGADAAAFAAANAAKAPLTLPSQKKTLFHYFRGAPG
jgi:hypothetical protein